jgi:methionyl-tRNA formyltransferase
MPLQAFTSPVIYRGGTAQYLCIEDVYTCRPTHTDESSEEHQVRGILFVRFAIAACDRYLGVFEELLQAGWEPVKLFSVPATTHLDTNRKVIELAQKYRINIQLSRMSERDLAELGEHGCETLMIASYNWRIGNWRPYLKHAVNFHPSPLPEARGPYPMTRAILERRASWAVTCHKIEPEFDAGDIVASETFSLAGQECHESLNLKLQMASARLARHVAGQFSTLWDQAKPQGAGSYWPYFTEEDRTIHFSNTVEDILVQVRAFGSLECIACINGVRINVRRVIGWTEAHDRIPCTVAHTNNQTIVVATLDGYVAIVEWSLSDGCLSSASLEQMSLI